MIHYHTHSMGNVVSSGTPQTRPCMSLALVFHHYFSYLILPSLLFVSAPKCRDTVSTLVQMVDWYCRFRLTWNAVKICVRAWNEREFVNAHRKPTVKTLQVNFSNYCELLESICEYSGYMLVNGLYGSTAVT